jgi:signal transduction histidine kinase
MRPAPSERLLVGAGWFVSVAAGLPQVLAWASGRVPFERRSLSWCVAYGVFAIAFLFASATPRAREGVRGVRGVRARATALAVQSAAALAAFALGDTRFEGALLCVVAGEAPLLVGERRALVWLLAQCAGMVAVNLAIPSHGRRDHLAALAYAGFQLFAFGASRLAVRESAARAELTQVHAELLATQELLADSTRTAERLRIARELHDALGHHVSALSLQLELARNLVDGRAKEPVAQAHAVTKTLLAELRSVVSSMREDAGLDLAGALHTLVAGIPHPRVHLEVARDLQVEPALAHTIFRCVQEALTNAVRHAGAENVYLTIEAKGDTVAVTARDDGRGASEVQVGHGLSGLRERIEGMGGRVEIEARQGAGLTLRALLPTLPTRARAG